MPLWFRGDSANAVDPLYVAASNSAGGSSFLTNDGVDPKGEEYMFIGFNPKHPEKHIYAGVNRLLSYFDTMNMAEWITCPVLISVGLQDDVCPPHTSFALYNAVKSKKEYRVYPFAGHGVWWELLLLALLFYWYHPRT